MPDDIWKVEIYTAQDQATPEIISHCTWIELRKATYAWLLTTHPLYVRSGTNSMQKEGQRWQPLGVEDEKQAYRVFCDTLLDIQVITERLRARQQEERVKLKQKTVLLRRMDRVNRAESLPFLLLTYSLTGFGFLGSTALISAHNGTTALSIILLWAMLLCGATLIVSVMLIQVNRDHNSHAVVLAPGFHSWFKQYGIEATATVVWREILRDGAGVRSYWLEFAWQHPQTLQRYTTKVHTRKRSYDDCPLGSTHPMLFDPADPLNCQFYRSEVHISNIVAGAFS